MKIAAVVLLLVLPAAAQLASPDLTGTWRLDRDLTTADLSWNNIRLIVVSQSDEEVSFDYFDEDRRRLGTEVFVTDGKERPRYSSRLERAYARARWRKQELEVTTRSFLDVYGYQTYSTIDRWELSADGKTLSNRSSDGKVTVFYKAPPSEPVETFHQEQSARLPAPF